MNNSKIEWTEQTWNPTVGCNKVSSGCKNCYAETMSRRLKAMGVKAYEDGFEFKILPERLNDPKKIKKPTKFFVNSMSDLFHEKMPFEFLDKILQTIKDTPQHAYQILTKREKRMYEYFRENKIPDNIWLGVSVESYKTRYRIDYLRKLNTKIKFISMEPLIDRPGLLNLENIDWVIVGGESGVKARPMKEEWATDIKNQCAKQNVAFFFKQWGTWGSDGIKRSKKKNGRELNGKVFNEYPDIIMELNK